MCGSDRPIRRYLRSNRRGNVISQEESQLIAEIQAIDDAEERLRMELQDPLTDVTTPEVTDSEPEGDDEPQPSTSGQPSSSSVATKSDPATSSSPQPSSSSSSTTATTTGAATPTTSSSSTSTTTEATTTTEAESASQEQSTAAPSFPTTLEASNLFSAMLEADWQLPNPDLVNYGTLYNIAQYRRNCRRKLRRMKAIARRAQPKFRDIFKNQKFLRQVSRIRCLYTNDGDRRSLVELIALYCYLDNLNKEEETSGESDDDTDDTDDEETDEEDSDDEEPGAKEARIQGYLASLKQPGLQV